jgi:hypothetical protein
MYAFGHHYTDSYTPLNAPVYIADTKFFVESNSTSFKYSDLTGYYVGSLSTDNYYGVNFNSNIKSRTFTSRIAVKFYTADSLIYNNLVANNTNYNYEYNLAAQIPSIALYINRDILEGTYVKVTGTVKTFTGITKKTENISFNTFSSTVDLDLNDLLNYKFNTYTSHIDSQRVSLSIQTSTYADSVIVPIIKK